MKDCIAYAVLMRESAFTDWCLKVYDTIDEAREAWGKAHVAEWDNVLLYPLSKIFIDDKVGKDKHKAGEPCTLKPSFYVIDKYPPDKYDYVYSGEYRAVKAEEDVLYECGQAIWRSEGGLLELKVHIITPVPKDTKPSHVERKEGEPCTLTPTTFACEKYPQEKYNYVYTGEFRTITREEDALYKYGSEIFRSGDDGMEHQVFIVKPIPKEHHTVRFTDGVSSMQKYTFFGPIDWERLEKELVESGAIHALIDHELYPGKGDFIWLTRNGEPRLDGSHFYGWTTSPATGWKRLTSFTGWGYTIDEYANVCAKIAVLIDSRKRLLKTILKELKKEVA